MENGLSVLCPFRGCEKLFSVKSSFSSHLSRKRKTWSLSLLLDSISGFEESVYSNFTTNQADSPLQVSNNNSDEITITDDEQEADGGLTAVDQYLRSVALFYLKLQEKLLLPSSTIQNIIEEYQDIRGIGPFIVPIERKFNHLGYIREILLLIL